MKTVQTRFFRSYNVVLTAFLAILGFACTKESLVEYGTPNAKFIVNGNVSVVNTNTPIQNIRVTMNSDTTYTDSQGNYQVVEMEGFPGNQEYVIKFHDIDNLQNGNYKDIDTTVKFIDPQFTGGDGHWYKGETSQEFNVKLDSK